MTLLPDKPIQRYVTMSRSDDLTGYWRDALGFIAYYFAQLEGLSHQIINSLGSSADRQDPAVTRFRDRTVLAKRLICQHFKARGESELSEEWAMFLTDVMAAAPLRNMILHNPLSVNVLSTGELTNPDEGIVLVRKPGHPVIKLGAVQHFAGSVRDLNQRMLDLLQRSSPWHT